MKNEFRLSGNGIGLGAMAYATLIAGPSYTKDLTAAITRPRRRENKKVNPGDLMPQARVLLSRIEKAATKARKRELMERVLRLAIMDDDVAKLIGLAGMNMAEPIIIHAPKEVE